MSAASYKNTQGDLFSRILFTLSILIVCRIGSFIPVAGIDSSILGEIAAVNESGILGMFNMLSGGSLARNVYLCFSNYAIYYILYYYAASNSCI
jgi:preprotein translocase subunit SecY